MKREPKISVIIPVYNCEKYIHNLLETIESQTYENLEIICINDGSTDRTNDILMQHKNRDNRIQIIYQENLGAGAARNRGLQVATGDYLAILDADDLLERNMFEEMLSSAIINNSDIVICRADGFSNEYNKINIDYSLNINFSYDNVFNAKDTQNRAFNFCVGWTWDKLFKRSFIESYNIRFQELRRADDLFFTFFAIANAQNISICNKYLIHHRYHNEQMSQNRDKALHDFCEAITKLYTELVNNNLYNDFQHSFIYWLSRYSIWQYNSFKDRNKRLIRGFLRNEIFKNIDILSEENKSFCDQECLLELQEILWDHGKNPLLVSVIVSGFNVCRYIESAINSVVNQTYENIEIILIDDGSTDNTKRLMEQYANNDSRIRLFSFEQNSPGGVATAANFGIEHSRGEYIAFCDGDDWLSLTAIEDSLQVILKTKADFVYSKNTRYNETKKKYISHYDENYWLQLLNTDNLEKKKKILCLMGTEPWKKLYSKRFLEKNSLRFPVGEFFYEDSPFHFLCVISAERIALLNKTTYYYRINRIGATTSAKNNEKLAVYIHLQYMYKWIKQNDVLSIYKETLLKKALRSIDFIIGGLNIFGFYKFYKETKKFFQHFTNNEIRNQFKEISNIKIIPLVLSARAGRFWLFSILYFIKRGL